MGKYSGDLLPIPASATDVKNGLRCVT